jgi:hypothetical protein
MSRQIINVGTAPNDGLGDPLRTAYIKCNDNFAELYSRAQSEPPVTAIGSPGDEAGMYAYDENTFYYCYANYDGSSTIWGQLADFQPTAINNGTSNIVVGASANITVGVAGVSNLAVFSTAGIDVTGNLTTTGNLNTDHINTTGSIKTNANIQAQGSMYANNFYANASLTSGSMVTGNVTSNATVSGVSLSASGNITGGNVVVTGVVKGATVSATGNVTGGNLITAGAISATGSITSAGNVSGTYILGDGQYLTNITAASNVAVTQIANGTSILSVNGSGGSILAQVGGVANVAVVTSTGVYVGGLLSVTGNANVGNLGTAGLVTATGNVTAGNIRTAGQVSATGNITGGNLSVAGNVSGSYILGNGAFLSGVITSVANINNGTSNITIGSSGGPATIAIGGVANLAVFNSSGLYISGLLDASANITGGNIRSNSLIHGSNITANAQISAAGNITGGNLLTSGTTISTGVETTGTISATGNITGGNINATNHTGTTVSVGGNITGGNLLTSGLISATGNITGDTLIIGNIVNSNANGVGNIGSATTYFNTVFAKATSAQYADLAEYYLADASYPPGTVVKFGGNAELTIADQDLDPMIAGVVSTNPAYAMNSALVGEHVVAVALIGRTPCLVKGPVRRGQMMVSAGNGYARAEVAPTMGTVIGKSLEDFYEESGEIEILVGRL